MTCGSDIGNAEKHCKALCSKLGFELMGVGEVVMPENYVAMFYVPNDDEAKAIVKKALPVIDGFAELIAEETGMPVSVAANPLDCVVLGTAKRLEADSGFDNYVFRRGKRFR